jgi:hypothetical protein
MRRTHSDEDGVLEWREIAALTELKFLLEVTREIMVARELDRWTKRGVGLHENFARRFAATRATGDLREKLKCALAGAEIGQMQGEIGVDDPYKCYVREMQAFRDHLCADENIDLACAKISQRFAIRFLAGHGIRVHAAHHRFRKDLRHS